MPSPFPGMDPYIEACGLWETFHYALAGRIHEQLAVVAPERYHVRPAKRDYIVLIESEEKAERPFVPDVSISATTSRKKGKGIRSKGGTAIAEPELDGPVTMRAFIEEEHREIFVEIYENGPDHRLVTAIEILSPSNKRPNSTGREQYLRKRQSLLVEGVNFIEIDLLRGGEKMPMMDEYPKCPYTLLVARSKKADLCKVWPAYFTKPLPAIPVPLLKGDADLTLQLQPLVETVYQLSRYDHDIDYTKPLTPPLDEPEQAWLRERLRAVKA